MLGQLERAICSQLNISELEDTCYLVHNILLFLLFLENKNPSLLVATLETPSMLNVQYTSLTVSWTLSTMIPSLSFHTLLNNKDILQSVYD